MIQDKGRIFNRENHAHQKPARQIGNLQHREVVIEESNCWQWLTDRFQNFSLKSLLLSEPLPHIPSNPHFHHLYMP